MLPEGALLTFSHAGSSISADVVVQNLTYSAGYIPFERMEYNNQTLAQARTACGEGRIIISLLGGKQAQVITDCGDTNTVPLVPNSDTTFNQVYKRFNFTRYSLQGALSEAAEVNLLYQLAQNHQTQLARFDAYLKRLASDTPYEALIALQSETFSYLTTSGVTASGSALESPVNNVLITAINVNNELSIPNSSSSYDFYKTYDITFETRSISNLIAT